MAAEGLQPGAELNVAIGDDAWMQELNAKYKGRPNPTDVLSFPQDTVPEGESSILGDIAISVETAQRQAQELGHSLLEEIEILLTHGVLHLTGWDDDTPPRRRRMMARTQELLDGSREAAAR
jgi:probable rRNA maturation factor